MSVVQQQQPDSSSSHSHSHYDKDSAVIQALTSTLFVPTCKQDLCSTAMNHTVSALKHEQLENSKLCSTYPRDPDEAGCRVL